MASAVPALSASSVSATPIKTVTTNNCHFETLPDQAQFDKYVSGLKALGTPFDISGPLTVRFFIGGNH